MLPRLGLSRSGVGMLSSRRELLFNRLYCCSTDLKIDIRLFCSYILTTRLDAPHKTDVTSLSFSPVPVSLPAAAHPALLLLSTSQDGVARLWREKRTRYKSGKVEGTRLLLRPLAHHQTRRVEPSPALILAHVESSLEEFETVNAPPFEG